MQQKDSKEMDDEVTFEATEDLFNSSKTQILLFKGTCKSIVLNAKNRGHPIGDPLGVAVELANMWRSKGGVRAGDLSLAGTNIIAGFFRDFNTFVQVDGYLRLEYFLNIGGGQDVLTLTNSAGYLQNNVDIVRYTNFAHIAATAPNIDNFGARFYGFFKPITNGDYTFFIRGDDGVAAYVTTNGVRQVVAARNLSANGTYDSSNPLNNNSPVTNKVVVSLAAGVYYPLEAVLKEGGGGDSMEFAVTANGQAAPATGGAATIPAAFLSTFADPDPAVLNITGQPASLARALGTTATFTVAATGSSPLPGSSIRYQCRATA